MTPQKQLEIIQAYIEGKGIEWKCSMDDSGWTKLEDKNHHSFNFLDFDYRIKPQQEIKYRPYTPEELKDAWLMHKGLIRCKGDQMDCFLINSIQYDTLRATGIGCITFQYLLEQYVWADDNSACGVSEDPLITKGKNFMAVRCGSS